MKNKKRPTGHRPTSPPQFLAGCCCSISLLIKQSPTPTLAIDAASWFRRRFFNFTCFLQPLDQLKWRIHIPLLWERVASGKRMPRLVWDRVDISAAVDALETRHPRPRSISVPATPSLLHRARAHAPLGMARS